MKTSIQFREKKKKLLDESGRDLPLLACVLPQLAAWHFFDLSQPLWHLTTLSTSASGIPFLGDFFRSVCSFWDAYSRTLALTCGNTCCTFFTGFLQTMILLQKTNKDWWSVRQATGREGYVPANYVKEVEPKVVQKVVVRPVKVQEKVKVMKTGTRPEKRMVPKSSKNKKPGTKKIRRTPSGREFQRKNACAGHFP